MQNYTADPCSAVAPLVRAMECIPEGENEDGLHGSSASLFSSIRNLNPAFGGTETDKQEAPLKDLKQRLESFLSCGWLTKQEYQQHADFLATYHSDSSIGANGKFALRELEKELDSIEEKKSAQPAPQSWSDMFMSTLGISTSKPGSSGPQARTSFSPLANATNRSANGATNPSPPTIVSPGDLSNVLSGEDVAELFVETCFFARLGFVQPPCCMSCTYREALRGSLPNEQCDRWVVWRRDAGKTFDPSNNADLGKNALVVQCRSARRLIAGKTVEGYRWDDKKRVLRRRTKGI
ncbi:unnamed protein product [Pseudo-nitzschia multistriata]|uniref:Uncharacterized protein n=1 Tax=Pseudo-nitzschia multistriata TaxID=183589 RepID=A0A448Z2L3_9STRA|nr:unnamed protein product [Pseudo-nitzschia multistriata]